MKKSIWIFLIVFFALATHAQFSPELEKARDQILEEGKYLYRLELASWYTTDIISDQHAVLLSETDGYCSYTKRKKVICIFWNKELEVIFTARFGEIPDINEVKISRKKRKPKKKEKELMELRKSAKKLMIENTDTFFTFYQNTNPNLIPVINDTARMVFVLTGSRESVVLLGNDYQLFFDETNKLRKKIKFHTSLIELDTEGVTLDDGQTYASAHIHHEDESPFMTSTDICTLLLYQDFFEEKTHVMISEKYICMFLVESEGLIIVPLSFFGK